MFFKQESGPKLVSFRLSTFFSAKLYESDTFLKIIDSLCYNYSRKPMSNVLDQEIEILWRKMRNFHYFCWKACRKTYFQRIFHTFSCLDTIFSNSPLLLHFTWELSTDFWSFSERNPECLLREHYEHFLPHVAWEMTFYGWFQVVFDHFL